MVIEYIHPHCLYTLSCSLIFTNLQQVFITVFALSYWMSSETYALEEWPAGREMPLPVLSLVVLVKAHKHTWLRHFSRAGSRINRWHCFPGLGLQLSLIALHISLSFSLSSLSWEPIVVLSRTNFTKMLNRLLAQVYLEPLQAESYREPNITYCIKI